MQKNPIEIGCCITTNSKSLKIVQLGRKTQFHDGIRCCIYIASRKSQDMLKVDWENGDLHSDG